MAMRRDSFYTSSGGGFSGYQLVSVHEFENVHETIVDRTDPSGLSKARLINKSRWDNSITANGIYLGGNYDDSQLLPIGNFTRIVTQAIDVPAAVAGASFCNYSIGNETDPATRVKIILFEDEPYLTSSGTYDGGVIQQRYANYMNINPSQVSDKTSAYNNVMPNIANFVLNHTFNIPGTYNNGYFPYYETTFDLKYTAQIISSFAYKTDNEGDSLKYWARQSTANPHGGTIGCIIVIQGLSSTPQTVGLAWRAGNNESEGWTPNNWYPAQGTHNYYNSKSDRTPYGNYAQSWAKRTISVSSVPSYVDGIHKPGSGYSYVGGGYTGSCAIAYIPKFNIESGYHWCMFHIER